MESIHEEARDGLTIKIFQDEDAQNPITDWDDLVTVACFHPHYNLSNTDKFSSLDEAKAYAESERAVVVPLYLYDHSGITISTGAFSCPWDSGLVGIAFIERHKALHEWGKTRMTPHVRMLAASYIEGTIKNFDDYLTGNVWGYVVEDEDGEDVDSCWGFLGDYDQTCGCLDEARSAADYHTRDRRNKHLAKVKAWIAHRVPLDCRQPCPV